jgi:hypothetical protein
MFTPSLQQIRARDRSNLFWRDVTLNGRRCVSTGWPQVSIRCSTTTAEFDDRIAWLNENVGAKKWYWHRRVMTFDPLSDVIVFFIEDPQQATLFKLAFG